MTESGQRQRVERVAGSRRARLTRVDGTLSDSEAEATLRGERPGAVAPAGERGANDDRLRRDRPPHW
ncbi:hypothetical protein [Microbacterium sediminis]|uniref:Uncharacterized protein n=1 Tax=Microbacterium sediminis TaxID=904291 RepID=A0A1B9N878_9MICO|nr:hypothetical protein [Microbacterium sediminis]OCG72793.1 hypothetical protein A7J15_09770 [Microbacterium sediminis]QBR73533.1 hypothetical protein E3O41_03230 [Microbacterium sediminis]